MRQRNRAAKRQRQYRARRKKREQEVVARYRAYLARTPWTITVGPAYGTPLLLRTSLALRVVQWQMRRMLNKATEEWSWLAPLPGGATDRTLDNPQGMEPVLVRSAVPEP